MVFECVSSSLRAARAAYSIAKHAKAAASDDDIEMAVAVGFAGPGRAYRAMRRMTIACIVSESTMIAP
jgi:hypothetical protein